MVTVEEVHESESLVSSETNGIDAVEIKFIFTRLLQKLSRFVFLGQIYYCYGILEDLPGIDLYGFPIVYLYAWIIFAILIGFFLFMFGRTTLFDRDVVDVVTSLNWSFITKICDGTVYRFFCIWLHWLYPYVVASAWACYFQVKIPHTRFLLTYYSLLAFVELKDYRGIRWFCQVLTSAAHLYVSTLAEDIWGITGSIIMLLNMILVMKAKDDEGNFKFLGIPGPVLMGFTSLGSSFIVSKSIQMMSSTRWGDQVGAPEIGENHLMRAWERAFLEVN